MWFKRQCLNAPIMMFVLPLVLQMFSRSDPAVAAVAATPLGPNEIKPLDLGMLSTTTSKELRSRLASRQVDFSSALEKSDLEALYLEDMYLHPDKKEFDGPLVAKTNKNTDENKPGEVDPKLLMQGGGAAENGMGLMQWGMIGTFVLYFGSYGPELFTAIYSFSGETLKND